MTPSVVVFDIGAVLVDWQPELAWLEDLGSMEAVAAFMERTDFKARNARAAGGETFADLSLEIADPEDRKLFASYVARYTKTVPNEVPGTWALLDRLKDRGVPVHAITNWSAETWGEGLKVHPRLAEVFGTLIVSGREHLTKPDPAIYRLLCERAKVLPEDCVFIDDGPHNIEGAKVIGMDGIHFTSAEALERDLHDRGLLRPTKLTTLSIWMSKPNE